MRWDYPIYKQIYHDVSAICTTQVGSGILNLNIYFKFKVLEKTYNNLNKYQILSNTIQSNDFETK